MRDLICKGLTEGGAEGLATVHIYWPRSGFNCVSIYPLYSCTNPLTDCLLREPWIGFFARLELRCLYIAQPNMINAQRNT